MMILLQTTIEAVKGRSRDRCDTAVESMHLQLYDDDNNKICDLLEDYRPLGYYSPYDGYAYLNSCSLRVYLLHVVPSILLLRQFTCCLLIVGTSAYPFI